jgi:dipeptidyl aminopeptidase/acylaminoacyl peptidase
MDALGEGNQTAVFWSPDGTRLATMSSSMVPGTANMVAPLMRSELRCVVYDMGSREVLRDFEFAATRALLRILPYFDQYSRSFDVWSPDSRCLLLPTMHDERMEAGQLTVYDVETDAPPRVWQSGQLAVWSPRPAGGVETEARAEGR